MDSLRPWLVGARPGQALLAPLSVAVGASYAHLDAHKGPGLSSYLVVTIAAFAAAIGVNLIDHAWGLLAAPPPDPKRPAPEPIPEVGAKESALAGVAAMVLAALCGIGLASLSGSAPLGYGLAAVLLGVARGAPAVGLDTLDWRLGEVANVIALGPLAAMAGFASQAGSGSSGAFFAGIPSGIVAASALFPRRGTHQALDAQTERGIAAARPLFAVAAIVIAARFWEYGPWAITAALPMVVAAGAAWRFPPKPTEADFAQWGRLALVCASVALACLIVALGALAPE
jgi:1,4-dihydroxy-2-naphthoate octaprenyltransferase